jgi:phage-related protein (TIGR01555 family)
LLRDVRKQRTKPSLQAQALGLQAAENARAFDFFSNQLARTGAGTSSLENGTSYDITRWTLNYWAVLSMFETSWVARRIVEAPAQDIVKTWPNVLGEIDPKDLDRMSRAVRKTNTKSQMLEALIWGRLFGGAGALIVIKGHENELDQPLNLDDIQVGAYKGLSVFDRWSGITPSTEMCDDIERPLDVGLPEYYECRSAKGGATFKVHSSRILRFTGPTMPEPEKSAYSGWGISILAPVVQTIMSYDNVSYNALSLSYRAQIIGMRNDDLAGMLSGLGSTAQSSQKFYQRMQDVNELLSNQSLVILPKDGELSKIEYSFSGLSELKQSFQLDVSGAAKMPVSLLWGRTLNGLGQAGDGDERIYEKTVATEANTCLRPALEKLYPVIAASELGEVPADMDLNFPSIRVLTEQEKSELAKTTADTLAVYMNGGVMSPRVVGKEVKQSSDITGIGSNLTDEDIAKLSDEVSSEGEVGGDLFGGAAVGEEGGDKPEPPTGGLNPASSPSKALKEEDRVAKAKTSQGGGNEPGPNNPQPRGAEAATGHQAPSNRGVERPGKAADSDGPGPEIEVHGLPIVIETPKGYPRHGRDEHGKPWQTIMPADYGYLKSHLGADGDSLDCYVGPDKESLWIYCIDQSVLGDRKRFDESKVMLGFSNQATALAAYDAGHHRAKDILLDWTPMTIVEFEKWLAKRNPNKPCSPEVTAR